MCVGVFVVQCLGVHATDHQKAGNLLGEMCCEEQCCMQF